MRRQEVIKSLRLYLRELHNLIPDYNILKMEINGDGESTSVITEDDLGRKIKLHLYSNGEYEFTMSVKNPEKQIIPSTTRLYRSNLFIIMYSFLTSKSSTGISSIFCIVDNEMPLEYVETQESETVVKIDIFNLDY